MVSKTVLAALAVSGVSAIELFPGHQGARRDLRARQTAAGTDYGDYTDCATALIPIYDTLPSLPADILSYEATATEAADACEPTYPPHISSELKVYETEVLKWYSSNSAAIESALSECPQYSSEFASSIDETPSSFAACGAPTETFTGAGDHTTKTAAAATTTDKASLPTSKTATTEATTPAGKTTTAAATEPTTPGGNTGTPTKTASANAGPRETAYLGAAVAAAVGMLGFAMAL